MLNFLGIGDNVCDVYVHERTYYPGGQALNAAIYLRRLGARSAYWGLFGSDELAARVQFALDREGVDRSRCRTLPGPNGFALVALENGDRRFIGSNRGGLLRKHPLLTPEREAELSGFDLIHTSNNSYLDGALDRLKAGGALLSYDFSTAWRAPGRLEAVCPRIDFAFFSCGEMPLDEAEALLGRACRLGCRAAVATLGGRGALLRAGAARIFQPPERVEAVDALGAGDSFAAAFLHAALTDTGEGVWPNAMRAGARFAAQTCLARGAFGYGAPASEELIDRLRRGIIPKD